jgi:predicted DNA-binding protein (UPF0251 family)
VRGRKRQKRNIQFKYSEYMYKPSGIPNNQLDEITILDEELEALRLQYLSGLDQRKAALKMGISQSQFQRDVVKVIEKIIKGFIEGKAFNVKRINNIN